MAREIGPWQVGPVERGSSGPTGLLAHRVVMLCAEDDDLAPGLVRVIDLALRRAIPIEVVVVEGDDPMPPLVARFRGAVFVVVRSPVLGTAGRDRIRSGFAAFRRPEQALWELDVDDVDGVGPLVDRLERALGRGEPDRVQSPHSGGRIPARNASARSPIASLEISSSIAIS